MSIDLGARALRHPHAAALLGAAHADARRLVVPGVHQRHVGDVDGALLLDHAHGGVGAAGRRALVALDDVQAAHEDSLMLWVDADDPARLALVLAGDDDHLVVRAEPHQSTSGASETI